MTSRARALPAWLPVAGAALIAATAAAVEPHSHPRHSHPPGHQPPRYHTHGELTRWGEELARSHRDRCRLEPVGTTREGRELWALRLAAAGETAPEERPALLIVGGLDGEHLVGTEVAMHLAETLLLSADGSPPDRADADADADADDEADAGGSDEAGDSDEKGAPREPVATARSLLRDHTIYIVPRVNADAAERYFEQTRRERRRNVRPDDADRDGLIDEDPPDDLNGDGLVTMMRVFDPAKATRRPDPDDARLDAGVDRAEGETALFAVMAEGADDDGDGAYNEDDLGGVDLNRNFMHGYREHDDGVGPHQVSEPETRGLIDYVLARQNIAVVLVYGRHDNLSKSPKATGSFDSGAPKTIDKKDEGLYRFVGERFRDITGIEKAPAEDADGAFFAWAYAQFGVPSFATPIWTRPEVEAPDESDDDDDESGENDDENGDDEAATGSADAGAESGEEEAAAEAPAGRRPRGRRTGGSRPGKKDGGGDTADHAWLAYSDTGRNGAGFVAWEPFEHPQLGRVEIGGWHPYFRVNPPPEDLPALVGPQVDFVIELADRLPQLQLAAPVVRRLAAGLFEVETALLNDGYFPTGTAQAVRTRRGRPHVVRLNVPLVQVRAGNRVHKTWSVPGSGGREELRWIIEAGEGTDLVITVFSEKYGGFETTVPLRETPKETGAAAGGGA